MTFEPNTRRFKRRGQRGRKVNGHRSGIAPRFTLGQRNALTPAGETGCVDALSTAPYGFGGKTRRAHGGP